MRRSVDASGLGNGRNKHYPEILKKNNMKVTKERLLNDFRDTMKEIINVKNGRQRPDGLTSGKQNISHDNLVRSIDSK